MPRKPEDQPRDFAPPLAHLAVQPTAEPAQPVGERIAVLEEKIRALEERVKALPATGAP